MQWYLRPPPCRRSSPRTVGVESVSAIQTGTGMRLERMTGFEPVTAALSARSSDQAELHALRHGRPSSWKPTDVPCDSHRCDTGIHGETASRLPSRAIHGPTGLRITLLLEEDGWTENATSVPREKRSVSKSNSSALPSKGSVQPFHRVQRSRSDQLRCADGSRAAMVCLRRPAVFPGGSALVLHPHLGSRSDVQGVQELEPSPPL